MTFWLVALLAGVFAGAVQYGRGAISARVFPVAVLRALAVTLVVALLLGAVAGPAHIQAPDVVIDASQSWLRATDSAAWRQALDAATRLGSARSSPIIHRFGDSLRIDASRTPPVDRSSTLRGVIDAASGSGRPVVVITDGELDEPELLSGLPRGSRTLVVGKREGVDVAVSTLEAPRTLLAGDTASATVTVVTGAAGAGAGRIDLRLDNLLLDSSVLPAMSAYGERSVVLRGSVSAVEGPAVLRAIVHVAGDADLRNDTLALGVDITNAPAAVFVSTAPDYDAREAVAALRGVTSLPTRAFYRVAPAMWRNDAGLVRVEESIVRDAVREAPMVVLHGDTAVFGMPRIATRGSLLLFAPPIGEEGEWFAFAAPASPIGPAIGTTPFDSVPPLSVSPLLPTAEWQGLLTRRGGSPDDKRAALVGWETPRRIAVLGASGFWRWRFRGGVKSDAYATLFGALFDWLAAGRVDRRAVVLDGEPTRSGMPIRWRRGAPSDSAAMVVIAKRGDTRRDSIVVRFADGSQTSESPSLPAGIYDITASGGASVLAVNESRELIPRRPTISSANVGGEAALGDAPRLRDLGWVYALAVLALCAEWLLRRRVGLR